MMPSSCLATSTCLLGYRWLYVSIVVCTFSCPRCSAISSGEKPISTSRLAWLCHYGIITTNGKSLDFQGVSAFVAVYSIPFPKLKYGEKIDEKRRLLH